MFSTQGLLNRSTFHGGQVGGEVRETQPPHQPDRAAETGGGNTGESDAPWQGQWFDSYLSDWARS